MRNIVTVALALIALSAPLHAAPTNLQQARPIIKAQAANLGVSKIGQIKLLGPVPATQGVFKYQAVRKINPVTRRGGGAASGQVDLIQKTATFQTIFPFAN
jgi:hypothetical protein